MTAPRTTGIDREAGEGRLSAPAGRFLLAVLCLLPFLPSASSHAQESIDIVDTWATASLDGWTADTSEAALTCEQLSGIVPADGYLGLTFPAQSMPAWASTMARRTVSGMAITNLSFRFLSDDLGPSALRICLHSKRQNHLWYMTLAAPTPGTWQVYNVSLDTSAKWIRGPDDSGSRIGDDLGTVDWVAVYVRRPGDTGVRRYGIDDFRILARSFSDDEDSDADGMTDAWESLHGLDPYHTVDGAEDTDGDTMSNYAEFRAGTDPANPGSLFQLDMAPTNTGPAEGFALLWNSISRRTYTIWRMTNWAEGFLRIESNIPGTPPRNTFNDTTATDPQSYFYRIQVDP